MLPQLPVNDFAITSNKYEDSSRIGKIFRDHYSTYNGFYNPAYNGTPDRGETACYYVINNESRISFERRLPKVFKIYTLAEFEALLLQPTAPAINNSYSIY